MFRSPRSQPPPWVYITTGASDAPWPPRPVDVDLEVAAVDLRISDGGVRRRATSEPSRDGRRNEVDTRAVGRRDSGMSDDDGRGNNRTAHTKHRADGAGTASAQACRHEPERAADERADSQWSGKHREHKRPSGAQVRNI